MASKDSKSSKSLQSRWLFSYFWGVYKLYRCYKFASGYVDCWRWCGEVWWAPWHWYELPSSEFYHLIKLSACQNLSWMARLTFLWASFSFSAFNFSDEASLQVLVLLSLKVVERNASILILPLPLQIQLCSQLSALCTLNMGSGLISPDCILLLHLPDWGRFFSQSLNNEKMNTGLYLWSQT